MNPIKQAYRLIQINFILLRYGLDDVVFSMPWFAPIRFLSKLNPWNWRIHPQSPRGERIRLAFEALGPIFIKLGQMLSTRRDLIPEDIADELAKLQDCVPPFSSQQARLALETALEKPFSTIFATFDDVPLASASVAQVHAATLLDGTPVAVKILRPNIEKIIQCDLALMRWLASLLERYWRDGRRLKPKTLVHNFAQTLLGELDLQQEAANATTLKRHFQDAKVVAIPCVYWDYTRSQVLTLTRMYGIPIGQMDQLRAQHVNLKKLAERVVEIFFTQVFRDCFFHADMHPGNILVDAHDPQNPRCLLLDFGIIGTLSRYDRRYLAENLLAFFDRDYRLVAELHVRSGWVPKNTSVEAFATAIRTVCEPLFDRPLKNISCAQILLRLFQTAERFQMELQPQLVLLQKTLFNVEGLGRQLYPELDLWQTAKPCLDAWLKQETSVLALARKLGRQLPYWLERLPDMPEMLYDIVVRCHEQDTCQPVSAAPPRKVIYPFAYFLVGMMVGGLIFALL